VCNFFSWHYRTQFLWKCRGSYRAYNNCECWAAQSHTGNISVNELCPCQFDLLYFPQRATAPTAQTVRQVLRTVFLSRLSSFGDTTWPARSTNVALPDYFLWGYVKQKVYKTHPANNDDWIWECILGIPKEMLHHVLRAFLSWLQKCTEWHGSHIQSVTQKQ